MRFVATAAAAAWLAATAAHAEYVPPNPQRHHERVAAIVQQCTGTEPVVLIGSSTIELLGVRTIDPYGRPESNAGVAGAEIPEIEFHLESLLPRRAGAVTVIAYCGENDLAAGLSPATALGRLEQLLLRIKAQAPAARLTYVAQKHSPKRWELRRQIEAFNRGAHALISSRYSSWAAFIELPAELGIRGVPAEPDPRFSDGLHFSDAGYANFISTLRNALY